MTSQIATVAWLPWFPDVIKSHLLYISLTILIMLLDQVSCNYYIPLHYSLPISEPKELDQKYGNRKTSFTIF